MYVGPFGAWGFISGCVARQASKATPNSGRKRRSAITSASLFPTVNAANQASNVVESKLRRLMAWRFARLALERSVEASASRTRDSVLHFAAAKPDQAAISATIESRMASMIEILRF